MTTRPDPLAVPWHPVANDLIGGWAVATEDVPPSRHSPANGVLLVADFISEDVARHVAALHNAALAGVR